MKKVVRASEVEALLREIQRYLAYMDAFRSAGQPKQGCEPQGERPKES